MTEAQVTHDLKTWPAFFTPLADGVKHFEIRRNDRIFRVGDDLLLREYDPHRQQYTGREVRRTIIYMTNFNQLDGFVVLGLDIASAIAAAERRGMEEAAKMIEAKA